MRMTSSTSQIPAQSTLAGLDLVLNIILDSILDGLMMMMMMKDLKVLYCWKWCNLNAWIECLSTLVRNFLGTESCFLRCSLLFDWYAGISLLQCSKEITRVDYWSMILLRKRQVYCLMASAFQMEWEWVRMAPSWFSQRLASAGLVCYPNQFFSNFCNVQMHPILRQIYNSVQSATMLQQMYITGCKLQHLMPIYVLVQIARSYNNLCQC